MSLENFRLIDTTLREGEQFSRAHFTSAQKFEIARELDAFGIEYIEVTNPASSPISYRDAETLAGMGLRAKILAHCRCNLSDVRAAVQAGVQGVNVLFGTSEQLRAHSHGRSIEEILETAREVISYLQTCGVETRFSCEDAFRTPLDVLLRVYEYVDSLGVDRVGIADTVGVADPLQVHQAVAAIRERVRADIEFHGHNDSGCAIANAYAALQAGATHIDTTVLGIGERNGITPLGGMIARLHATDRQLTSRYDLHRLSRLDQFVSEIAGIPIPFNNYITGETAFSHKAGIHTKAVLANPVSYEALDPADFGLERQLQLGHRLTGWNAVAHRVAALNLVMSEEAMRAAAAEIRSRADMEPLTLEEVDDLLRSWSSVVGPICTEQCNDMEGVGTWAR